MELFSGPDGTGNLAIIVCIGGGALVVLVTVMVDGWRRVRVAEQNAVLKQSMIEKGFTADEIERVVASGAAPVKRRGCCSKEA